MKNKTCKCKIHAMLSSLLGAITISMAGMPFSEIGISNPYIIIGLGAKGYLYKRQGGSKYAEK